MTGFFTGANSETLRPRRPQVKKLGPSKSTAATVGSVDFSKSVCNQIDKTLEDLSPTSTSSATESIPNTFYPRIPQVKKLEPSESTVEPIPNACSSNPSDSNVRFDPNFPKLCPTYHRLLKPNDISFSSKQEKLDGELSDAILN